jgi:hypothetical protein
LDLVLHATSPSLAASFVASFRTRCRAGAELKDTQTHADTHTAEAAEARARAGTASAACVVALAAALTACARQEGQGLRFWAVERARVAVVGFEDRVSGVRGDISGDDTDVCMWRVM